MGMNRRKMIVLLLPCFVAAAFALNLLLGPSSVSVSEIISAALKGETTGRAGIILMHIRLPRALGALIAGACLAVSGSILQSVLGSPLASPGVIGVNSGAGLFSLAAMTLFPRAVSAVPYCAFAGAMLTALTVYLISVLTGASRTTLILSGVAISTLLSGAMDGLCVFFPDASSNRTAFSIGGFDGVTMAKISQTVPLVLIGLVLAFLLSRQLTILSMGDETAQGLGVRASKYRLIFLTIAALLSACSVSIAGIIGFVGLIGPHIARILTKGNEKLRIMTSALCGSLLCLVCDLGARLVFAPFELPVGVVMSFIGVPFFLFLLLNQKRRNGRDNA